MTEVFTEQSSVFHMNFSKSLNLIGGQGDIKCRFS